MKYIKTKDNIYEITDLQYNVLVGNLTDEEKEEYKNVISFEVGNCQEYPKNYESVAIRDIILSGDSPEELCDEFVWDTLDTRLTPSVIRFINKEKTKFCFPNDDYIFELDDQIIQDGIFGCIWVKDEDGFPVLKSVCKMVNPSRFELKG